MQGKAAGAPLRAIGTLGAIWILARVISWNLSADIVVDPSGPIVGRAEFYNVAPIRLVGKRRIAATHVSATLVPRDIADRKFGAMIMSLVARKSDGPNIVTRPVSQRRFLLTTQPPEIAAYRLPPAVLSNQNGSRLRGFEPNISSLRNAPAKHQQHAFGGYFWIFARQATEAKGSERGRAGAIISNGQYGGSQIGAILSYPISTRLGSELTAYGRVTAALAPLAQKEVALGARIRPVQKMPFSLHAEQRLSVDSGGRRGTAFYVAGGTGPDHMAEKVALETYAQAGYVLGRNETYFFDGSATLQRLVIESDRKKLSVGAGAWVGGQRQIGRLDVGPRADFIVPLGSRSARLAVDWRVRVAGNARPGSGMAITVSTGF